MAEVDAAFSAIEKAFSEKHEEAIARLLMTDHVAAISVPDTPMNLKQELAVEPDVINFKQIVTCDKSVSFLGPDTALITFVADFQGSFREEPLPARGFVTAIMVRRDGQWLERLYQVTEFNP
ncbi:MAG: nuclear transport factor 2 family protein [Pseudomonadota bacterium]